MVSRVKVSNRNQIAVPAEVRKELGIEAGDYLLVEVRAGRIVLIPEPDSYTDHLRGLGAEVWKGVDPVEYVRAEREAWRRR